MVLLMCVSALPLHGGAGQGVVERSVAHREAVPLTQYRALLPILKTEARAMSDGTILVDPADGDLRRIEGRLAKSPSFWTSRVEVAREYQRIGGVRVPIRVASLAWIRLVGVSMFEMTYEYEEINGKPVGHTLSINQR